MRAEWILLLLVPGLSLEAQTAPRPRTSTESASRKAAIVCQLEGQATIQDPSGDKRDLALFDWLTQGVRIQTRGSSKVVLVFAGGERYEMAENSGAMVGTRELLADKGHVEKKNPVPMIPSMARTTVASAKGKPGSITVRRPRPGESWCIEFHPPADAAVLADEAVLSFQPRNPGGRFQVQVLDAVGRPLHSSNLESERLTLPPGLLKPGAWYTWRVNPVDPGRGRPVEARFRTVEAKHAEVRARLKAEVDTGGDPGQQALLAAMDRWLGLQR